MSSQHEWIIQRLIKLSPTPDIADEYEDWPGYTGPMTREAMLEKLKECARLWSDHEFRGHRVAQS